MTNHQRFPANVRWTGVLQSTLGDKYEVIEEGLNSRTLKSDDNRPGREGRNGKEYLIPCLDSHEPLDLVILMLGTNELKDRFDTSVEEIGKVVEEDYVKVILGRKTQSGIPNPKLILISPPILDLTIEYARERYAKSAVKNKALANVYKSIAIRNSCEFIDSSKMVYAGSDGVHFDAKNHKKFGMQVAKVVKNVIS